MNIKKTIRGKSKKVIKKVRVTKKRVTSFVKDKRNRKKLIMVAVIVVVVFLIWKFTKKSTTTTPGNNNENGNGAGRDGGALVGSFPNVSGPIIPEVYYSGMIVHNNFEIEGSDGNYLIHDRSTEPIPPGHELEYQIGGDNFRQPGRLVNYPFKLKGTGALRILVSMPKNGATGMEYWGTEDYQDPNLYHTQSENTSLGTFYIVFTRP